MGRQVRAASLAASGSAAAEFPSRPQTGIVFPQFRHRIFLLAFAGLSR